jgi:hypothetical protein
MLCFPNVATAPSGPGLSHCPGFTITLRHTTLGRTPLDEWSARRTDLYLTTHNTDKIQGIHARGRIRTRNPIKWTAADPRLRPRGHWDWHNASYHVYIYFPTPSLEFSCWMLSIRDVVWYTPASFKFGELTPWRWHRSAETSGGNKNLL